jgi:carboxypeptidase Taq
MTVSASTPSSTDLTTESTRVLYDQLVVLLKDLSHIKGIASLLGWDQLVMMPKNALDARANQVRTLRRTAVFFVHSIFFGLLTEAHHVLTFFN